MRLSVLYSRATSGSTCEPHEYARASRKTLHRDTQDAYIRYIAGMNVSLQVRRRPWRKISR